MPRKFTLHTLSLGLVKKLYSEPKIPKSKPRNFKDFKKAYLAYLLHRHSWRWIRFTTIGAVTMGLGFLILFLTISDGGIKPIFGYLIENAVTLQIGFLLNRYLTFSDRDTHWFKALLRWYAVRAASFGAGQACFFLLVNIAGLQYMLASLTIAMTLGLFSYSISNFFTFAGRLKPAFVPAEN